MPDSICPTFGAGTMSIVSDGDAFDLLADKVSATGLNGYTNQYPSRSAGSFNFGWANGCLVQSVTPTFSTSLVDFGTTGRQS